MNAAPHVRLQPGRVYRTRDLPRAGTNASRLARRLASEGRLERLARGLFYAPRTSRFGTVPPDADAVLRAFLDGADYMLTGSDAWNALGLGTTGVMPVTLVYNRKRSGAVELGGQRFLLRRVAFPRRPKPEWYVVDLLGNLARVGADAASVERNLAAALAARRFSLSKLLKLAELYGTQRTRKLIRRSCAT